MNSPTYTFVRKPAGHPWYGRDAKWMPSITQPKATTKPTELPSWKRPDFVPGTGWKPAPPPPPPPPSYGSIRDYSARNSGSANTAMQDEDYEPIVVEWDGGEAQAKQPDAPPQPQSNVAVAAGNVNPPSGGSVNVVYGTAQEPARAPPPPPPPPSGDYVGRGFSKASESEDVLASCPPVLVLNKDTNICETDVGLFTKLYHWVAGSSTMSLIVVAVLLGVFGPALKEKILGSQPKGPQKRLGGFDDLETNSDEMAGLMSKVGGSYDDDDDML